MSRETLDTALEYLDRGWSFIPIRHGQKNPAVNSWKEYQYRHPTEQETYEWFENTNHDIAVICGKISGVVVVDTDNAEATEEARRKGWDKTPYKVKTKKGYHYYWSTDQVIGKGKLTDKIDLQGEASYVLAPPSTDKVFQPLPDCDPYDLPRYSGPMVGVDESNVVAIHTHTNYEGIDLSKVVRKTNAWEEAEKFIQQQDRKLREGDNCHNRIVSWIGHLIASNLSAQEVYDSGVEFCEKFMDDPFDDKKIIGVMRDLGRKEEIEEKYAEPKEEKEVPKFEPITTKSIDGLEQAVGAATFFVDPIIPSNDASLTMIFGYSGHGKSMFTRNMLYAACVGKMNYGPFILADKPRVLYLDLENGRKNILKFLKQAKATYGDAGENFMMYAPFEHEDMNLRTDKGVELLFSLVKQTRAQIVCIDTVRTAFPGMNENEGREWAEVNTLILMMRNAGISVVLVHHANKPQGDGASGSYAGSTNAISNLEFGIKITQIFDEQDRARARAGIYTGDIESEAIDRLPTKTRDGENLAVKMEVRFVKNREADESLEDLSYIGFAQNHEANTFRPVFLSTKKQRAMILSRPHRIAGTIMPALSDREIAIKLDCHVTVITEWLKTIREKEVENFVANTDQ